VGDIVALDEKDVFLVKYLVNSFKDSSLWLIQQRPIEGESLPINRLVATEEMVENDEMELGGKVAEKLECHDSFRVIWRGPSRGMT
jgi:hypothetical protein